VDAGDNVDCRAVLLGSGQGFGDGAPADGARARSRAAPARGRARIRPDGGGGIPSRRRLFHRTGGGYPQGHGGGADSCGGY